jgi:hypothetical protein
MKLEGLVVASEKTVFVLTDKEEQRLTTLLNKISDLAAKSYAVRYDHDKQHYATERTNTAVDQFKKYLFKTLDVDEDNVSQDVYLVLHTLGDVQDHRSVKQIFKATANALITPQPQVQGTARHA